MRPGQPAHGGRRTAGPRSSRPADRRRRPGQDPRRVLQLFRTRFDWSFSTVPQEHVDGRRFEWPRGRMIGGSSSMNAMLYVRGNGLDYDTWRDVHGCTGWGYADLLPYFMPARTTRAEPRSTTARWTAARGGPALTDACQAFVEAAAAVASRATPTPTGPSRTVSASSR